MKKETINITKKLKSELNKEFSNSLEFRCSSKTFKVNAYISVYVDSITKDKLTMDTYKKIRKHCDLYHVEHKIIITIKPGETFQEKLEKVFDKYGMHVDNGTYLKYEKGVFKKLLYVEEVFDIIEFYNIKNKKDIRILENWFEEGGE